MAPADQVSAAHLCLQEIEGVTNGSQLRPPQIPTRLHNELESVLTSLEQLLLRDGYDNHFDGHKSDDLRLPGQLEAVPDSVGPTQDKKFVISADGCVPDAFFMVPAHRAGRIARAALRSHSDSGACAAFGSTEVSMTTYLTCRRLVH